MNRIAKCLCMVAVIALTFTACKKNENDAKMVKFNATTEQLEVVDDEVGGRMYIDANNIVQFDENDEVAVFNCPNTTGAGAQWCIYRITGNGNYWTRIGGTNLDHGTGVYYAYYPGGTQYVHTESITNENRVKFTLMPTQDYRVVSGKVAAPQNALYMAAKSEQTNFDDVYLNFRNVCGILSMRLYNPAGAGDIDKNVTSIELTDNTYNIVGNLTLKIHEVDPVEMKAMFNGYNPNNANYMHSLKQYMHRIGYQAEDSGVAPVDKTLTLNCVTTQFPDGVELGTSEEDATEFYFVLRPLALINGCEMIVHFHDGTTADISSTLNHTIAPNQILKMRPIDVMTYHP